MVEYNLGELFCGPGGMALGAKLAKDQIDDEGTQYSIKHLWGVDKDEDAIHTYNINHLGEGVCGDAMSFSKPDANCGHKTIADFENINALAFGFPCNDFSTVGKYKGSNGFYGALYKAGIAAIEYSNPDWFIAENVSGIKGVNSGKAFEKILSDLEEAGEGYEVASHLYKFEEYGVPQYRHRYIIVGIKKSLNKVFYKPAPIYTDEDDYIKASTAIDKVYPKYTKNDEEAIISDTVRERLEFTPPWRNAWYLDKLLTMTPDKRRSVLKETDWYKKRIINLSDKQIEESILRVRLNCKKARMSHIYRRLHPNLPAYTITGSGGGGTHVYHYSDPRPLSNRERARLQSFPDDFEFKGNRTSVRKQIGMAVPPMAAKIIFESILKTLAGIKYDVDDRKNNNYEINKRKS